MKLPILTEKRLKSIGIYHKLKPHQRKKVKEGAKHEMEHLKKGQDPMIAVKISYDHIKNQPNYYTILKKSGL